MLWETKTQRLDGALWGGLGATVWSWPGWLSHEAGWEGILAQIDAKQGELSCSACVITPCDTQSAGSRKLRAVGEPQSGLLTASGCFHLHSAPGEGDPLLGREWGGLAQRWQPALELGRGYSHVLQFRRLPWTSLPSTALPWRRCS